MTRPLCFVLMPFGRKPDGGGGTVDFDLVYRHVIRPAVEAVGLEPIRADEEQGGGLIHKAMFERLILCPFAVADLTAANANVFYELGIRHAVRPFSTVLLHGGRERLPFDVAPDRSLPYALTLQGEPADPAAFRAALEQRLRAAMDDANADSPLFQLVDCLNPPVIDHTRTDVFRQRVAYSDRMKRRLAEARRDGPAALAAIEAELGDPAAVESGVLIDLFLSWRAVKAWDEMIRLARAMPAPLARTAMVRRGAPITGTTPPGWNWPCWPPIRPPAAAIWPTPWPPSRKRGSPRPPPPICA